MRPKKILLIVFLAVIAVVCIPAVLAGCLANPTPLMNQMKKSIPDAVQFVEDYEASLSILLELQAENINFSLHPEMHIKRLLFFRLNRSQISGYIACDLADDMIC